MYLTPIPSLVHGLKNRVKRKMWISDTANIVSSVSAQLGQDDDLRGQCHEIFCLRFFSWIILPQAPLPLVLLIPLANWQPVSQYWWQICNRCHNTGGKLPPVSATPAANFPPVSKTLVANNGNNISCCHLKVNMKEKIYQYVYMLILLYKGVPKI